MAVECKGSRRTLFGSRSNNNDRDVSSGLVDTPSNSDSYYLCVSYSIFFCDLGIRKPPAEALQTQQYFM